MQNSTAKRDGYGVATEWLTSTEAALYLKIDRRTLLQYARQGKVQAYILSGTQRHVLRFKISDLDAMLTVSPTLSSDEKVRAESPHIQGHAPRFKGSDLGPVVRVLETYKNFRAHIDRNKIEASTGLYMDAGTGGKQDLYRAMKKDPATGEWVLYFHFGK